MAFMAPAISLVAARVRSVGVPSGASRLCRSSAVFVEPFLGILFFFWVSLILLCLNRGRPGSLWIQPVGALEWQHPPWILTGKSADLIQLPKLVLGECEFDRREIVLKLVQAFRANDDRGDHRLCQEPCEREACRTTSMCFRDRNHRIEDLPGPLFVHQG